MRPSVWASTHRVLSASMSAEPGPWINARTPYLAGIMDALVEPHVEEIVCLKAAQVGFSEALRNVLGHMIDQDPGPCLMVMPSETAGKQLIEERIKPLLFETEQLKSHVSSRHDDTKLRAIKLDTMSVYIGWAGSPQALASRPIRYVMLDEVDKYPPWAGREADPISLAVKRTTTYGHRARIWIGSTPTTRDGPIWTRWESCGDQRYFHVPCPYCKTCQRLVWSQVKWPKLDMPRDKHADEVELREAAWYECEACGKEIHDKHKTKMLSNGKWVGSDQVIQGDKIVGPRARTKRIGFHINSLYSPWVTFSRMAGEFIRSVGNPIAMMDFRNSRLAEPFEHRVSATNTTQIAEKVARGAEAGIVPDWYEGLYATADTQADRFYWIVRAWGYEYRSQMVAHGVAADFDELMNATLESSYGDIQPTALLIDSGGSRTNEVYEFAARDAQRIIPIRGSSHAMRKPWTLTRLDKTKTGAEQGVGLRIVDTAFFKDMLARLIHDEDLSKWMPHGDATDDYIQQMASEHKILDPRKRRELWVPVSGGAANHYWDCEVYQCAAAYMAQLGNIGSPRVESPAETPTASTTDRRRPTNFATGYKGKW